MKQEKITTSKGEFLVVDLPSHEEIEKELQIFGHDQGLTNDDLNNYFRLILPDFNKSYELSEITEEQASEIVYISWEHKDKQYSRYYNYINEDASYYGSYDSAIESLHSLLKSKGIHLYENPYTDSTDLNSSFFSMQEDFTKEKEAEEKTFYNPYIFKL